MSVSTNCYSIVIDCSNILYRTFYANKNESSEIAAGLAMHSALVTINKYYKKYRPNNGIVMAFDRKTNWRKIYTASADCLSGKPYKGNRRQNMSPSQQIKYAQFLQHLSDFEKLITNHTTLLTLAEDGLEADDLIAGYCEKNANVDGEIVVVSADTDLLQLIRYPSVSVLNPATDKFSTLEEYDCDPLFYLFAKCVRGDPTDNVQSAFPRVRMDRIKKAYLDPFERVQMMKETWTNQQAKQFSVEQIFNENQLLIDLSKQPANIRELINETIDLAIARPRKCSMFHILKFVGQYKLVKVKESIDTYIEMLGS